MHCVGEYVLFLNAKDRLLIEFDPKLILKNSYIEVRYINFWGWIREVPKSIVVDQGIPYCHQGMILQRERVKFDERDRFGADYSCFLNFADEWPFPKIPNGLIWFDTTGVSTQNRKVSDAYTADIIKRYFGIQKYIIFKMKSLIRFSVKESLSTVIEPYTDQKKR